MGEIDKLIGESEVFDEENPSVRQDLLNRINSGFMKFPLIDLESDTYGNIITKGFSYRFQTGATTPGYTDQIAGKFKPQDNTLSIFYAKGIHAGWITLRRRPDTEDLGLVNSRTMRKDAHDTMSTDLSKKPYLHAVESLIDQLVKQISQDPSFFLKHKGSTLR